MPVADELANANARYAAAFAGPLPRAPGRQVAVVTCMDCRIDLPAATGIRVGEAHVIRNAGGLVTDDVLRSLAISQRALGTRAVLLVHHSDCGMLGFDDDGFRAELAAQSGQQPPWRTPGFADVHDAVRRAVAAVRGCPWLPHRDDVHGFVYDVGTGELAPVG